MKFAPFINIQCREDQDYNTVYRGRVEEAELAERFGFDAIFLAEHAFCRHGRPSPVVTLANIAARTKSIRLGTAISVLPWHNPLEVAQDYATLDILSDGRLEFGVGRGAFKMEFDGYGIDWEESQPRYEECLEIILKAWTGEPFNYDGEYYKISEVAVNPLPVQRPHPPLWTPTVHPVSMKVAVERGITPMVGASFSPLTRVKENFHHLDAIMKEAGRKDLYRVAHPHIYIGDTVAKAREEARESVEWLLDDFAEMWELPEGEEYPERFKFQEQLAAHIRSLTFDKVVENDLLWIGDIDYVTNHLRWLRDECGVNYIISNMSPGGMEHEKVAKSMELLATKVMPQLN